MPFTAHITDEEDVVHLRKSLVGRSVVKVEMPPKERVRMSSYQIAEGIVHLDDGTKLLIAGNEGCGGCPSGEYTLTMLNDIPLNGIMDVQMEVDQTVDSYGEGPTTYKIFVLAMDGRQPLAQIDGDDGNGYYGTGFYFSVVTP